LFCIQFYYITSDQANKHGITPILLTGFCLIVKIDASYY